MTSVDPKEFIRNIHTYLRIYCDEYYPGQKKPSYSLVKIGEGDLDYEFRKWSAPYPVISFATLYAASTQEARASYDKKRQVVNLLAPHVFDINRIRKRFINETKGQEFINQKITAELCLLFYEHIEALHATTFDTRNDANIAMVTDMLTEMQ